ncbi:hypothetical protein JFK97_10275 [Chromobacterium phragmitis]|nr:hypothetical protein [Chromobacterium amazonense]KIA80710.1 hypothetical protein QR66_08620 [Chromobacterium piscinae]MBM2884770.1 hypothetical protein [Chromobacterium amazonense]
MRRRLFLHMFLADETMNLVKLILLLAASALLAACASPADSHIAAEEHQFSDATYITGSNIPHHDGGKTETLSDAAQQQLFDQIRKGSVSKSNKP